MNAHEHAQRWLQIFASSGEEKKQRAAWRKATRFALLRRAAQYGLEQADAEASRSLARDFRGADGHPWRRWRPGQPMNVGSGRKAQWHHLTYLMYACFAEIIHRELGWSGDDIRRAAKVLTDAPNLGFRPRGLRQIPDEAMGGRAGQIRATGEVRIDASTWSWQWLRGFMPDLTEAEARDALVWFAFMREVAQPAWGQRHLDFQLAELRANPERHAVSMLVGEVRRLRGATGVTDFRGCSGCEYLTAVADRPECHDFILSRAREPHRVVLDDGREACVVPFGLSAPEDFTECVVLGVFSAVYCRPADKSSLVRRALGLGVHP